MIKRGDKVSYKGHEMTVEQIYGAFVDLLDERIPFLPVHVIGVHKNEIKPIKK